MKVISFDPNTCDNIPNFFNSIIDENLNKEEYIMFVFNDIKNNIINFDEFVNTYELFLNKYKLPYIFYPYYIHFNRIFPNSIAFPNPRAHILQQSDKSELDIIGNPAYGLLILNLKKINSINFRFNPKYAKAFYIYDLIRAMHKHNLWISSRYFIDVKNSFNLIKNDGGFEIPSQVFGDEKNEFIKENNIEQESINDFIKNLKEYLIKIGQES